MSEAPKRSSAPVLAHIQPSNANPPLASWLARGFPCWSGFVLLSQSMGPRLASNGDGGDKRTRTADICLAKAALYQLSYTPIRWALAYLKPARRMLANKPNRLTSTARPLAR